MMKKKIKYLLLIFPLLFLTNVNAAGKNLFSNKVFIEKSYLDCSGTISSSDSWNIYKEFLSPNTTYTFSLYGYGVSNFSIFFYDSDNKLLTFNDMDSTCPRYRVTISSSKYSSYTFVTTNDTSYMLVSLTNQSGKRQLELGSSRTDYEEYVDIATYTYRFLVDEEVYSTGTVEENTVIELPEAPTKEGYTFNGWTLNGEEYTGGPITSDIDIIANFTENQITPTPTTNVDLSVIVPYLILISALIMLFIEINFIRNLFKSRR